MSRPPTATHLPPGIGGRRANTVGRPPGSDRVTISPSGLWYSSTRGRAPAALRASGLPSSSIRSPVPARSPSRAGAPFRLTRPAAIQASICRREPWPAAASSFCRRSACGRLVGGFGDGGDRRGLKLQRLGNFLERRQLLQRAQPEVVEGGLLGGVKRRPSRRLPVPDGVDPAAALQGLDDLRGNRDAADVLDVAARDRLAVGGDGGG